MTAVAIWGTFDVDNYGDHLFAAVARAELGRRLPGVTVDAWSPLGWLHRTRLDAPAGRAARPLGPRTEARLDLFAAAYDAVLVGGGELIHGNDRMLAQVYRAPAEAVVTVEPARWFVEGLGAGREERCPLVWNAVGVTALEGALASSVGRALAGRRYVAVRDPGSRRRLEAAGVTGPVAVVPDTAVLVDRLYPPTALDTEVRALRQGGLLPDGPVLLLQGCDLVAGRAVEVARAVEAVLARHPALSPVILETGPCRGDRLFAEALAAALGAAATRLPASLTLRQTVAVIRDSAAFVGTSLHGAVTCLGFDRPFLVLDLAGEPKLAGLAAVVDRPEWVVDEPGAVPDRLADALAATGRRELRSRLQGRIDAHFDEVAGIVGPGRGAPCPDARLELERSAVVHHTGVLRELAERSARAAGLARER
ncbi:MAG TPA: polysaccharide pyruvyl transferase family protein, partial [Acidimicrobiales bacterium]|nr:polysaccharide pyruvyl transferase family protein [Acidimicrobiales bacterium]